MGRSVIKRQRKWRKTALLSLDRTSVFQSQALRDLPGGQKRSQLDLSIWLAPIKNQVTVKEFHFKGDRYKNPGKLRGERPDSASGVYSGGRRESRHEVTCRHEGKWSVKKLHQRANPLHVLNLLLASSKL